MSEINIVENNFEETNIKEQILCENKQDKDQNTISDDMSPKNLSEEFSDNNTFAFKPDSLVDNDTPEPNCLALTVKKDYDLTIVKNVFTTTGRLSWKIVLITTAINILNMLF